eukprot:TRINITY_DN811_c0_g1_i1.p1 TRINITY_DN811_c0_g1~~TRINITY_DN811_c0_g1_i1.p1  ORF type:complete len:616 (+),score=146.06 TRINITY_DN811_c0_g1_i1:64-1848(+)
MDSSQMFAVSPRSDCPHIRANYSIEHIPRNLTVPGSCNTCKDTTENWICLKCFEVNCSRHVKGHALEHFNQTEHPCLVSFSDLSVWCYLCTSTDGETGSYIVDRTLSPFLRYLGSLKFPHLESSRQIFAEMGISDRFVLFPHQTPEWSQIEPIISKKYTTTTELEQGIGQILKQKVTFFSRYFHNKVDEERNEAKVGRVVQGNAKSPSKKQVEKFSLVQFFDQILPFIQSLILRTGDLFSSPLPILYPGDETAVTLSREQAACLLAHAFFGTLQRSKSLPKAQRKMQEFGFHAFMCRPGHTAAMECILNYFLRLSQQIPKGNVVVRRRVLTKEATPDWSASQVSIDKSKFKMFSDGNIENSEAEHHADFANEYIGGGVLHGGNVQEEILFLIKPECLTTLLFCAKMEANEVILITGAERFSDYRGYGFSFAFDGNHVDQTPLDESTNTLKRTIVAMDAIRNFGGMQFEPNIVMRDLNKAYCAFLDCRGAFATGNWGCGAFGGDFFLKVFQQLLAGAQAKCEVWYFTFGKKWLEDATNQFLDELERRKASVGDVNKAFSQVLSDAMQKQNEKAEQESDKNLFELILSKMDAAKAT